MFSPDKQFFVLGQMNFDKKENTTVTVFKSSNLEEVATFPGRGAFAFFSNNNRRLAYVDGAGINIFTINTASGK
ncbi:MAG: hypothetical protein IPN33_17975 [Saprospiraceae bacterium]|nr:hypothetical protein [Saprospiraceae bacterium]